LDTDKFTVASFWEALKDSVAKDLEMMRSPREAVEMIPWTRINTRTSN
jgi:hypothetical protein